ncbi:McrC family protein [Yaniella halotolerans]|uniref:McrC family protein n=1 Tax=Yaniella halotolerans TaxID=225453 RepID=UPI0003B3826D|nr:hypothetical protein [Yaniella halotolerans]
MAQQLKLQQWFRAVIEPAENGLVRITPGSRVGGADLDGLKISVGPKIPVYRLLTMISEIADPYDWLDVDAATRSKHDISDALAALFIQACHRTFEQGMHRSYRRERQRLGFVRGKLLIPQTIRQLRPVPVTVETDVFDDDTPENQVLAAVLRKLRTDPHLSDATRQQAHHVFRDVRHVANLRDPLRTADDIVWTRHNQWYRQAVSLATLILSFGRVDHELGEEAVPGFFINMPHIIERWIRDTLRRAWGLNQHEMRNSWNGYLWLDETRRVQLQPDLAVQRAGIWTFVGDVKYKVLPQHSMRNAGADRNDIYQMLAYLTATGLQEGFLIYAGIGAQDETITIQQLGATIHIVSLDLSAEEARSILIEKTRRALSF